MKRYTHTPRHPDLIAGLNDAATLSSLADRLDEVLADLGTQPAQQACIHAIQTLRGTARQFRP